MLAAILQAEGYKTGLFTSPHLTTLRERVRVNGRMISKPSLTAFVDRHHPELVRRQLSFFEVVTAMAFDYFRRAKVDVAVIETGLGGRLDATNTLRPILTLTTEISRDHVEILGRSLPKIAREKAGIIKSGVPHLISRLPESAEKVIRDTCFYLYRKWIGRQETDNIITRHSSVEKCCPRCQGSSRPGRARPNGLKKSRQRRFAANQLAGQISDHPSPRTSDCPSRCCPQHRRGKSVCRIVPAGFYGSESHGHHWFCQAEGAPEDA